MTHRLTKPPVDKAWLDYKLARDRSDKRRGPKTATIQTVVDVDPNMEGGSYARVIAHNCRSEDFVVAVGQLLYMLARDRPDIEAIKEVQDFFVQKLAFQTLSQHRLDKGEN